MYSCMYDCVRHIIFVTYAMSRTKYSNNYILEIRNKNGRFYLVLDNLYQTRILPRAKQFTLLNAI